MAQIPNPHKAAPPKAPNGLRFILSRIPAELEIFIKSTIKIPIGAKRM